MSKTSITTQVGAALQKDEGGRMKDELKHPDSSFILHPSSFRKPLKAVASLRLTVVLFALALVLVFLGTLAQVDLSTWAATTRYFRSLLVWVPFQVFVRFGQTFFGVDKDLVVNGAFPYPGGWALGALLLINLLAAHAVRFKLSWKRSGILLIHAGLIVMMLGELVTGLFAVEGNLTIHQGESSNFLEHRDASELAVISQADDKSKDDVVIVPGAKLRNRKEISDKLLPFDIAVKKFLPNSALLEKKAPAGPENPADRGEGMDTVAVERAPGTGVDKEARFDVPSAYLTFTDKGSGKVLGTWLMSAYLGPQQLEVDGKTYDIVLRFKRTYKPYTMHLKKVTAKMYPGTDIPKDYSSLVQLVDPEEGEDRTVLIYMNQPLRYWYRGETFYQSSVADNVTTTVLQVVRNPGWMMPYVSCCVVALGMLIHFGLSLHTFLGRRALS